MNGLVRLSRNLGLAAGLFLCNGFMMEPAMAAPITYNFTGNVTGVDPLVSSQFSSSSTMSGSMTVDRVDQASGNPILGIYGIQSFTVTIGGYTATLGPSPAGSAIILNGPGAGGFFADMNRINGENVNFLAPRFFSTQLLGPSTFLGGDALPMPAPSVSSFTTVNQFRLGFGPEGVGAAVSGVVTSLTAVPLPAAVVLFGVGLVALIGLGAGGLRNIRLPQA
jgi:hypothetical protein